MEKVLKATGLAFSVTFCMDDNIAKVPLTKSIASLCGTETSWTQVSDNNHLFIGQVRGCNTAKRRIKRRVELQEVQQPLSVKLKELQTQSLCVIGSGINKGLIEISHSSATTTTTKRVRKRPWTLQIRGDTDYTRCWHGHLEQRCSGGTDYDVRRSAAKQHQGKLQRKSRQISDIARQQ